MNQRQLALTGQIGRLQGQLRHFSRQPLAQKLVFAHRKPVTRWQGLDVGSGVKKLHLLQIVREISPKLLQRNKYRLI
jgi:hypothetical protein